MQRKPGPSPGSMSDSKAANLYCGISIAVGFRASANIASRPSIRADHDHAAAFSKGDNRCTASLHGLSSRSVALRREVSGSFHWRRGDLPAQSPLGLAHSPAWPSADCHRWCGLGAAMGQSGSGDAQGGCGVDSAWGEALARDDADDLCDAHRIPGRTERSERHVDGEGHRRAVQARQVTGYELAGNQHGCRQ
jgi:hypothetical protein